MNAYQNRSSDEVTLEYHEGWHDGYEAGCDVAETKQIIAFLRRIAGTPLMHFDIEATKHEATHLIQAYCQERQP